MPSPYSKHSDSDQAWMRVALDCAYAVLGHTGDNPAVGCVVVSAGQLISSGATQPAGSAHAEVVAVQAAEAAGHSVRGMDIFVTLEPCAFYGRTPSCAEMLCAKQPARVVVGLRDLHPQVNGKGIARLQAAGIEVCEGVLAEQIRPILKNWLDALKGKR